MFRGNLHPMLEGEPLPGREESLFSGSEQRSQRSRHLEGDDDEDEGPDRETAAILSAEKALAVIEDGFGKRPISSAPWGTPEESLPEKKVL